MPTESAADHRGHALRRSTTRSPTGASAAATMECAEIEVPLDYDDPDRQADRAGAAAGAGRGRRRTKVGSLLVNPGGPGGSGIEYAARAEIFFGEPLRKAFDIVGFDPRGVGASTPVDCLQRRAARRLRRLRPRPGDAGRRRAGSTSSSSAFGEGCVELSGELARPHVDGRGGQGHGHHPGRAGPGADGLLRRLLRHPPRRRPTPTCSPSGSAGWCSTGRSTRRCRAWRAAWCRRSGFETALRAYVENCVDDGDCFLGDAVDEGVGTIQDLLEGLDEEPIPGDRDPRAHPGARRARGVGAALRRAVLAGARHRAAAGARRQRRDAAVLRRPVRRPRPRRATSTTRSRRSTRSTASTPTSRCRWPSFRTTRTSSSRRRRPSGGCSPSG